MPRLGVVLACAALFGAALAAEPTCSAGDHASCAAKAAMKERRAASPPAAGAGGVALIQHRRLVTAAAAANVTDTAIAGHMRMIFETDSDTTALSLAKGLFAVNEALSHFKLTPPNITKGILVLSDGLLVALDELLPENVRAAPEYAEFRVQWTETFVTLPAAVQSIHDDLVAFSVSADQELLFRAIDTFLIEVSSVVTKALPEQTGDLVARFLGALGDLIEGVGDGIQAFSEGDSVVAVEMIYRSVKAAADDLVPPDVQNDDTYKAMVEVLDVTLGDLSRHVLEYKEALAESTACWKTFADRPRKRPNICDAGYTWDGEQWCIHRGVAPYTIQSRTNERYINIRGGSTKDGANVVVWNNPSSWHTQWVFRKQSDGTYTMENVNSHTFLYAEGTGAKGANVGAAEYPDDRAHWRLIPTRIPATYNIQNAVSGLYLNLEGSGSYSGTNVHLWDNPGDKDSQWRIRSAWGGSPFEDVDEDGHVPGQAPPKVEFPKADAAAPTSLLETSLQNKHRSGSLPSRCDEETEFDEKRGAWCYSDCLAGYESTGTRCKTKCPAAYPTDSELLCAESPAAMARTIANMVTETAMQAFTIASLAQKMEEDGLAVAGGLSGTMQAIIDAGKAFAHPICKV